MIFNAQARHFNLLLSQGCFCSTLLYYQAMKKARSGLDTPKKMKKPLLSNYLAIYSYFFKNFKTIRRCQFHNKPCAWRQVNRYILLHISWFFKQKLMLPLYQHYFNSFLVKERRKSDNLSLKSFFRTSEQPFATYFLLVSCKVCPVAIPEICPQTQGSAGLLATHSLFSHMNVIRERPAPSFDVSLMIVFFLSVYNSRAFFACCVHKKDWEIWFV